jgi:feruloyl esterase
VCVDVEVSRQRILELSSSLDEVLSISAETVPAGDFTVVPPGGLAPVAVALPEHVRAHVVVAPQVNIEVWLPTEHWNGRFQGVGGGGLAGIISYAALANALKHGYATASTDTGHVGNSDALWAIGRPDLVADYGHRAIHQMTLKAKAIVEAFYAQKPAQSYFVGCSTGGRQGLMEAQRYPDDYDGIVSGAPAINISMFHAGQMWVSQRTLVDPASYITPEQYAAIHQQVMQASGGPDGLIDNPRGVTIDFDAVQAAAGLSETQVATLRALYAGPVNSAGKSVYPGLQPGSELEWRPHVMGPEPFPMALSIYGHMVFEDTSWDWKAFNYDEDVAVSKAKLGDVMDAMDPDLSAFRNRGGKLIIYHGWSDPAISPEATRRYYEDVVRMMGGREATAEFARLFLLPGMGHCRGGSGPDQFDMLAPLVEWVEHGVAPERIVSAQVIDGNVARTRPLFPYPKVARWTGSGDVNDAANFVAVEP